MHFDQMSNVLQTSIYMFLHIPKQKLFQKAHSTNLDFFGGTCPKTKVGAYVKTTINPKLPYLKVRSLFQKLEEMGSLL